MTYLQFLRRIHDLRADMNLYFEIGCRRGRSLSLSKARASIAVDPDFNIVFPFASPTRLFKMTSDDYFATEDAAAIKGKIDVAFVDGMHLSEFALRDFINVEAHAHPGSWVILDDVLPEDAAMASRTRNTSQWTGDVYKVVEVLRRYRPDLDVVVCDIESKGLLLVRGLDPDNGVLAKHYAEIEAELVRDDAPTMSAAEIRALARPVDPGRVLAGL